MTPEYFYKEVETHLSGSRAERRRVLADLRELLDFGITPDELGSPADYARAASVAEEQVSPRYARVWDPTNPRILVPRVVGIGRDINLGAVAVKLGWLRPDDMDEDILEAIPARVMALSSALPLLGAGMTLAASAHAAHRSPGCLPSGWDGRFRPRRHSSTVTALLPGVMLSVGAASWSSLAKDRGDRLSRSVFASFLSFIGAGSALLTARSTHLGNRPQPVAGTLSILVVPAIASMAAGLIPIKAGLISRWREEGLHV